MIYSADGLWERLKKRSRRLQLADATDDQTHTSHALVTVLVFGPLGVLLGMLWDVSLADGLRAGFLGGLAFYLAREVWNRRADHRWKLWDGVCDVVVPCWVTLPVVFNSPALLWGLSLCVALLYFVLRPVD